MISNKLDLRYFNKSQYYLGKCKKLWTEISVSDRLYIVATIGGYFINAVEKIIIIVAIDKIFGISKIKDLFRVN